MFITYNHDRFRPVDWCSNGTGKQRKSEDKQDVSEVEAEEIFLKAPLLIIVDGKHSQSESRFLALGKTNKARALTVIFTLRQDATLIRVISARDQHRKERALYEQARS